MNDLRYIKIDDVTLNGKFKKVKIVFGKHHYLELSLGKDGEGVMFEIGATHHGVKFNASKVGGELDQVIDLLRKNYESYNTD